MESGGWLARAQTLVALVSALVGIVSAVWALSSSGEAKQSAKEAAAAQRAAAYLAQTKDDRERITLVYNEVIAAIGSTDSNRRKLAAELVLFYLKPKSASAGATAAPEDEFRQTMLDTLAAHANSPEEKVFVAQAQFQLQDQVHTLGADAAQAANAPVAKTKGDELQGTRVDVFWCERSGQKASDAAIALSNELSSRTSGTVRVRELPIALMRNSYKEIAAAEIRREVPGEMALADVLRDLSSQSLVKSGIIASKADIKFKNVRDPTPNYLSLFICPI